MKEQGVLVWTHVLLIWAAANYSFRDLVASDANRPASVTRWRMWVIARSAAASIAVAYVSADALLTGLIAVCCLGLPLLREKISAGKGAELETAITIVTVSAMTLLISERNLGIANAIGIPVPNNRIIAVNLILALLLFTIHGGTYIVRGILEKSGTVPLDKGSGLGNVDVKEFNRGRLIGVLERVLLMAVVMAGSYEAIGFIVAAKGLIRSREFETNRDMTEYFLIGSLTSVLIALITGSLAKLAAAPFR